MAIIKEKEKQQIYNNINSKIYKKEKTPNISEIFVQS